MGLKPVTFQLVAQRLKHYATTCPLYPGNFMTIISRTNKYKSHSMAFSLQVNYNHLVAAANRRSWR
jgi:hypothetical protein